MINYVKKILAKAEIYEHVAALQFFLLFGTYGLELDFLNC